MSVQQCPRCGAITEAGRKFCGICGIQVSTAKQKQTGPFGLPFLASAIGAGVVLFVVLAIILVPVLGLDKRGSGQQQSILIDGIGTTTSKTFTLSDGDYIAHWTGNLQIGSDCGLYLEVVSTVAPDRYKYIVANEKITDVISGDARLVGVPSGSYVVNSVGFCDWNMTIKRH